MTVKSQITQMLNLIPDNELLTVLEVVKHFVPLHNEDAASEDDLRSHNIAMEEYLAGETVDHNDINWN